MRFQTSIALFSRPFLFCLVATIGSVAFAEAEKVIDPLSPATPKFAIWTGGCSRSLRVAESHSDLRTALNAAQRLKQPETFVIVLEGESTWFEALQVLNYQRGGTIDRTKVECTVYEKQGCRLGIWVPINPESKADLKTAEEVVAQRTKNQAAVAAVYRVRK